MNDDAVRGIADFVRKYGPVGQVLRIAQEEPRAPWYERGVSVESRNGRWFVWVNVHGAGFRLGRVELQLYVYGGAK